ncbi:Uu.00g016580.m01.CDS01 [Anthostomella pinea]|uniref:Uu.00g016580.m01.CDS01 n=1 Tax=Anthostomella pinea TaxID=933095 RepID=A0AAI8VYQ4_9PEZI|nr:Uu.00g016580.m01.CDS01 [Anthostomella pinea]
MSYCLPLCLSLFSLDFVGSVSKCLYQELPETSTQTQQRSTSQSPNPSNQHGFQQHDANGSTHGSLQQQRTRSMSPQSNPRDGGFGALAEGVSADSLEERLRGLNVQAQSDAGWSKTLGERISAYENALTPSVPKQALGFKVVKRADTEFDRVHITDFPNEILTHILSHLHPDSHASVALVSKQFYTLVTTPHAWRMAFQRFFPGQDALAASDKNQCATWGQDDSDIVRSEIRYFTRLTPHASWRSEYLLRTRLLRSLSRGKPGSSSGGIGSSSRNSQSGKKGSAVLTYNTKLPSMVTHVHATFRTNGKKPPRVVHGAADVGVGSTSDPTSGKVEKWGLDDPFAFAQLDEVMPQLLPYGVGEGPAAVPNVMDVSQPYGLVGGEGFPGGRVFYRATGEYRGKYLGEEAGLIEAHPDIPKIPELSEGICSVWVAKSSSVPSMTQSVVGIMAGSSLGVVTAYALGYDPSGPRYTAGEISARWVLSPGVPIIALKVDDNYSQKRKSLNRVWAVALNALGEVFYLTKPPTPLATKSKADDSTKLAWYAGRTTYWYLVEATRRQARPDESGRNAVRGAYSPRSPSTDMDLKKDQMVAEAREIERFLHYRPSHFRKVCYGWDMRRRLEVDFAADDEHHAGESIFVVDCALEEDQVSALRRFTRTVSSDSQPGATPFHASEIPAEVTSAPSIFGGGSARSSSPNSSGSPLLKRVLSASGKRSSPAESNAVKPGMDDWLETACLSKELGTVKITASSVDTSLLALVTSFEDPLKDAAGSSTSIPATPTGQARSDIPGRRARLLGLGTDTGKVLLWNMREKHTGDGIQPIRIIQTESPEISCLALSALYLVHGGSDGLVQAWDPLASTLDPIRTLNSRSPGRMPRHLLAVNPTLRNSNLSAVGAIYLDPDPTVLHGVVAFGTFVRYWAYSSSNQAAGRKRRLRHSDMQGRASGRRHGGGVKGYIAAEAEELRTEQQHKAREQARLRSRFGVGLGDLTEEEALRYAEIVSQEAFMADEQRRLSASDTGSAADFDTTSTTGSMDTVTPEPSVTGGFSPPTANTSAPVDTTDESDYELQIQAAIRLSLLEGVNDMGRSPRGNSSAEYDVPITFKEKRGKRSSSSSPSPSHTPMVKRADSSSAAVVSPVADDDLELAIQLSLAEEESRNSIMASLETQDDEFPPLEGEGFGKGKGKAV